MHAPSEAGAMESMIHGGNTGLRAKLKHCSHNILATYAFICIASSSSHIYNIYILQLCIRPSVIQRAGLKIIEISGMAVNKTKSNLSRSRSSDL